MPLSVLQDCEAALVLDPGARKAARRRAQALRELGQHQAALAACARFLLSFPEHEQDINDLRKLLRHDSKRQRKVLALRKARTVSAWSLYVVSSIGSQYMVPCTYQSIHGVM